MKANLQKQLPFKYKDKLQSKHSKVISEDAVVELGWKGGQELGLILKDGQLIDEAQSEQQRVN